MGGKKSATWLRFFEEVCENYDVDGKVIRDVKPQGETPTLNAGENEVKFTCGGTQGYNLRATVSVITHGEPLRE